MVFLAFQYPVEIRSEQHLLLKSRTQRNCKHHGPAGTRMRWNSHAREEKMKLLELREDLLKRSGERRFFRRRKKRNEISPDGRSNPSLPSRMRPGFRSRHRRAPYQGAICVEQLVPRSRDRSQLVITHHQRLVEPGRAGTLCMCWPTVRIPRTGDKRSPLEP